MFLIILLLIPSCVGQNAVVLVGDSNSSKTNTENDPTSRISSFNSENDNIFVATNEWREIQEGQDVPSGLHYRINLETGKKEARLLTTDPAPITDEENQKAERHILLMKEMKMALKNLENSSAEEPPNDNKEKIRKSFRTYEELKKDFSSMNLSVKTELEIMKDFLQEYRSAATSKRRKAAILLEFEYLVHQYDNAVNFVNQQFNGSSIVKDALGETDASFRSAAALVIGAASQNNPKVKVVFFKDGILSVLIASLAVENDVGVMHKMIYALSSMLSNFPFAQKSFIDLGGIDQITNILTTKSDLKLVIKVSALISNFLDEKNEISRLQLLDTSKQFLEKMRQYEQVDFSPHLKIKRVCAKTAPILQSSLTLSDGDFSAQEKLLKFLRNLIRHGCCSLEDKRAHLAVLRNLKGKYEQILVEEPADDYFLSLLELCKEILSLIFLNDEL